VPEQWIGVAAQGADDGTDDRGSISQRLLPGSHSAPTLRIGGWTCADPR